MRYHNILKDNMLNGDGIRAVLFVSGCTHHCPECHNPITWNKDGGIEFDASAKEELFAELEKDYVSGITFSGGDPLAMYNREEVLLLIEEVKEKFPNKSVWVYSGWTKCELEEQGFWNRLSDKIDVFVEGKFEIAYKSVSYNWAGSTNQRVLRKESNFTINTSDPLFVALQSVKDTVKYAPRVIRDAIFEKVDFVNSVHQNLLASDSNVPELLNNLSRIGMYDFSCTFDSEMYDDFCVAVKNAISTYNNMVENTKADRELEDALSDFAIYESNNPDDSSLAEKLTAIKTELLTRLDISPERFDNWCVALSIQTKPIPELEETCECERGMIL